MAAKNLLCFFRKVDNSTDAKSIGITGFCRDLNGIFSTVFRAREGYSRSITILLMMALQIYDITIAYKTDYLFTRKVFGWGVERFTQISTVDQGRYLFWLCKEFRKCMSCESVDNILETFNL